MLRDGTFFALSHAACSYTAKGNNQLSHMVTKMLPFLHTDDDSLESELHFLIF